MNIRPLTASDLPDLLELCRETLPLDTFSVPVLHSRIMDEPNRNPAYQLSTWEGDRLAGVLLGGTRGSDDGTFGALRMFAVAPAFHRQGLASELLGELETRMRQAGLRTLRAGNTAPNYIWPGLDVRYTPAFCFLQKHGFERTGDAVNMDVDLRSRDWSTADMETRLDGSFAVRRLESRDRDQFGAWLQQWWGAGWHAEALASYGNDPVSTFVATQDDRICAFASYNVAALEGGFGPTGTQPSVQGRGLGRILLFRCMDDLKQMGHEKAEICWTGPISFYARTAGAVMSRIFWSMEKQL